MKKMFSCSVSLMLIVFHVTGQINYETTYYASLPTWYRPAVNYFNHMSPKWVLGDTSNIYLYHLNHSLYKHIVIPPQPLTISWYYVTEDLFDTDSTNLEYLIAGGSSYPSFIKIYREDGTLLFYRDSALSGQFEIAATDSGTKMRLGISAAGFYKPYEIYSLPGTMPCPMICNGTPLFVNGVESLRNSDNFSLKNPYPNPSDGQTHIPYLLPKGETEGEIVFYDLTGAEVRRYKVNAAFQDLILSSTDLSAGAYYYQLQTPRSNSEGKTLIVIK